MAALFASAVIAASLISPASARVPNQEINLFSGGHFLPQLSEDSMANVQQCAFTHLVAPGDSCGSIAYGAAISMQALIKVNTDTNPNFSCDKITPDDIICTVPDDATAVPVGNSGTFSSISNPVKQGACLMPYLIHAVDSCAAIQNAFAVSATDFKLLNPTLNCSAVSVAYNIGEEVCLQGYIDANATTVIGFNFATLGAATQSNNTIPLTDSIFQHVNATQLDPACTANATLSQSLSCLGASSTYSVSITQLVSFNANLTCTKDIAVGSTICTASTVTIPDVVTVNATVPNVPGLPVPATATTTLSTPPTTATTAAAPIPTTEDIPPPPPPTEAPVV
ncbi:hypothetical protein HDU98_004516, partial [Podochytrium sp. JEL0797]